MTTLQEKIDLDWEASKGTQYPQFKTFEGIHAMEEVESLRLGDLCDYTERLARYCQSLREVLAEEDKPYVRDKVSEHDAHLSSVATLLAQRTRAEI